MNTKSLENSNDRLAVLVASLASQIAHEPMVLDAMRLVVRVHFGNGHNGTKPEIQKRGAVTSTGITVATENAVEDLHEDFTFREVQAALSRQGYEVQAKNARNAISSVLRRLVTRGKLREVRKGTGGEATIYHSVI